MRALLVAGLAPLLAGLPAQSVREASFEAQDGQVDGLDDALRRAGYAAAERALVWLAERQQECGGWLGHVGHKRMDDYMIQRTSRDQQLAGEAHTGVTALCGMAFLAGGHLPGRGRHGKVVERTVRYVLDHVTDSGMVTDAGTRMYSHAFATLFLAECHGMLGGAEVKAALEQAIHLIVDTQNRYGGWRYNPFTTEVDLSVTVCQLQALRAARNIGIRVPRTTIDRALAYVMKSRVTGQGRSDGLFYYKIYGRGAFDKPREFAINAAAVTALASAGEYDLTIWEPALDFVHAEYAHAVDYYADHYYYWYGNYYACQAMFWAGGDRFRAYYRRITEDLLRLQGEDGSWACHTGPGPEFSTAVAALLLQLPRQYLPIFQR